MENDTTPSAPPTATPPQLAPAAPASPPPLIPSTRTPRRSTGMWAIVAVILGGLVLLGIGGIFLLQFSHGFASAQRRSGPSAQQLQEVTVEDNNSRHKIAVVDLVGVIMGGSWDRSGRDLVQYIKDQLELAAEDDRVQAVVLNVDSPGGEVLASDEISRAIAGFQTEHKKPVVASMQSLAASGGYYASAPCRWIVANEMTITGSIGVIMHGYNYRGLMDKVGIRPDIYKSGKFKDMMSGEKSEEEVSPEEKKMLQAMIDETYARFKQVVREGRAAAAESNEGDGSKLVDNWEEFADGRIFSGRQAKDYGFVDELGNFDTAVKRARTLADIPDANLVRYQRLFDLGSFFRLLGSSESKAIKIDLGVDMPRLQAGRLYFICPTVLR